jgi:C4-dicarboxylate-specific signal transduction histidine kinase
VAEFCADPHLLSNIIHPDDLHLYVNHRHNLSVNGVPEPIDFRIRTKNGECRWISHVCRTIYGPAGQSLGQRASNRDITEHKRAEEEIHQQAVMLEEEVAERQIVQEELAVKQQQLEKLNQSLEIRIKDSIAEIRQKDQLLIQQGRLAAMGEMIHNIAHQWRQPLNNIGLIVQNLEIAFMTNSLTPEEMTAEVAKTMDVIMHMSRTIDDFRNFYRTDKEKHVFLLKNTVDHALEFVGATFENCNIRVNVQAYQEVSVTGYRNEYAQVLLNILSNARDALVDRKIVEPYINIIITRENGRSVVVIHDNGGGIDEDILPKVFDPYFTTKEQGKGTGIGLYMSKAIIEQNMDGRLTVCNLNGGAEFRIEV